MGFMSGPITTAELSEETRRRSRASDDGRSRGEHDGAIIRDNRGFCERSSREHRGAGVLEPRDERSGEITAG